MAENIAISNFIDKLIAGTVVDSDRNAVKALANDYDRYTTKKFVEMFANVKKAEATIGNQTYKINADGVESLFDLLENGNALAPEYVNGIPVVNSDTTKDTVVLGGEFSIEEEYVTRNSNNKVSAKTVSGKSVILNDVEVSDNGYLLISPVNNGKITMNNVSVDGSSGKLSASNGPNTPLNIKSNGTIVINRMTETATNDISAVPQTSYNKSIYNAIEIWGNAQGQPKSIIIKDSNFVNSFSNNAINIFGMANGGKALIENCVFDYASNILRIGSLNSGFENSYNCVIEFKNCVFKNWDSDTEWGSFGLCQYDSNPPKNIYGTDENGTHITIKLVDCYRDEEKTRKILPYTDITKQFGPNVYAKTIVNDNEVITTYPSGTQLLVNGTMTDVSGRNVVDTQNRMMLLYGKLPGMSAKSIVPDEINGESTISWYPTFIIE